ncbi:MAG: CoA-binding protein, partial [Candidatus Marsarchaeota archaeon]|nr:CoA-binding protein [Candidatus Marsarchaeota archaeon]
MDILEARINVRIMLKTAKVLIVVGCSRTEGKPSHDVPKYLMDNNYKIIAVNPNTTSIFGQHSYKSIESVDIPADLVLVFRPSNEALDITLQANKKGIKMVWLQEGIFSEEAERFAKVEEIVGG